LPPAGAKIEIAEKLEDIIGRQIRFCPLRGQKLKLPD